VVFYGFLFKEAIANTGNEGKYIVMNMIKESIVVCAMNVNYIYLSSNNAKPLLGT